MVDFGLKSLLLSEDLKQTTMKGELTQEGSFITFVCEDCNGSGWLSYDSDGQAVEHDCSSCNGTGLEKFDREYIEKVFEQRNQYANDNIELRKSLQESKTSDGRGWKAVERLMKENERLKEAVEYGKNISESVLSNTSIIDWRKSVNYFKSVLNK